MKQPEWQRGGVCGALSSTSQQLNLEPSEQRERERGCTYHFVQSVFHATSLLVSSGTSQTPRGIPSDLSASCLPNKQQYTQKCRLLSKIMIKHLRCPFLNNINGMIIIKYLCCPFKII